MCRKTIGASEASRSGGQAARPPAPQGGPLEATPKAGKTRDFSFVLVFLQNRPKSTDSGIDHETLKPDEATLKPYGHIFDEENLFNKNKSPKSNAATM